MAGALQPPPFDGDFEIDDEGNLVVSTIAPLTTQQVVNAIRASAASVMPDTATAEDLDRWCVLTLPRGSGKPRSK